MKLWIFLFFIFFSVYAFSDQTVYQGGVTKFSAASPWDQNGSTLVQKKDTTGTYLLAKIYVRNWWGGVAYASANWQPVDMSAYKSLSITLKSNLAATMVEVGAFDASKQSIYSNGYKIGTKYQTIIVPLPSSGGIDLSKIEAIIFAIVTKGNYVLNINNITLISKSPFPVPPTPTPIPPTPTPIPPTPTPIPPTPTPIPSGSTMTIYNGESVPFSAAGGWDNNGSTLTTSSSSPHSSPNHLRSILTNINWWGSVAYSPNNWNPYDLSQAVSLSFWIKSSSPTTLQFGLYADKAGFAGPTFAFPVSTSYSQVTIPTSKLFGSLNPSLVTALVFSISQATTATYTVDIDDISAQISATPIPPTPIPTPIPVPSPVPVPTPNPSPLPTQTTTMKTNGRFLYDACGQKVILRGVSQMTCWTDNVGTPRDGMPMFGEIAKTGANVVRIVWISTEGTTIAQLESAITNAEANGLIPMIENHDQTCNWSDSALNSILSFWTQPAMVAMIQRHQKDLLLNFANEMGDWYTTSAQYIAGYSRVVTSLRTAGIHVPIILDSSKCGQDEIMIPQVGPQLVQADPDHNLIISLHIYWTDQNAARIASAISNVNSLNIPMIIGEFSSVAVDCATPILWQEIIRQAQLQQVGYLAWSWDNQNACPQMAMTTDSSMSYTTLWGWALQFAVTDPNSIRNTSVRSQCLVATPSVKTAASPIKKSEGKQPSRFDPKIKRNGVKAKK